MVFRLIGLLNEKVRIVYRDTDTGYRIEDTEKRIQNRGYRIEDT